METRTRMRTWVLCAAALSALPVKAPAFDTMTVRLYPVIPHIGDVLVERREPESADFGPVGADLELRSRTNVDTVRFFEAYGVRFPEGSYIHYNATLSALVMRNTPENHRRLGRVLAMLNVRPTQVEIDFSFVAFPARDVEAAARREGSAAASSDALRGLWMEGKGRLVASTKVLTRSGVNTQVQGTREVIYPTEYIAAGGRGAAGADDPGGREPVSPVVFPSSFETREAGVIVNVTPTVGPDGRTIDLTFVPEVCTFEGWDRFPIVAPSTGPRTGVTEMATPSFHSQIVTTSVVIEDGKTLVMGGLPNRAGDEWLYLFLTARRVDTSGGRVDEFEGIPLNPEDTARSGEESP